LIPESPKEFLTQIFHDLRSETSEGFAAKLGFVRGFSLANDAPVVAGRRLRQRGGELLAQIKAQKGGMPGGPRPGWKGSAEIGGSYRSTGTTDPPCAVDDHTPL
jgi:hypothetical protein